jgi:FAD/FMN-containing dehydrogenase
VQTTEPTPFPITDLQAGLKGGVIGPEDRDFDEARTIFYGGFDRRPGAIVRAADAQDVVRVIGFARDAGVELAVRGGGHSPAGHSVTEGGIVLDLRDLRSLEIDPEGLTAWAGAGLTALDYTHAAHAQGLATGFGDTGTVGIGGITLAGGIGLLVRKHGLTIDSLLAADVVTADGEIVRADADSHPDLFWGIRGGGGNLGVVTRFRYRLHEVGTIVGGMLIVPASPGAIESFAAEADAAPEELSVIAAVMPAPPMPFIPEEVHGSLVILGLLAYAGDVEAGERAVAPFRKLAEPLADMVRPIPYPEIYLPDDEDYHPIAASRTMFSDAIDGAAAETILDGLGSSTAMMRVVQFRSLGGAMARVPADATAFAHRDRRFLVNVAALAESVEGAAEHEPWVERVASAIRRGEPGAYSGFMAAGSKEGLGAAYPGATWDRLAEIKARYDPSNLFRVNHNVPPPGGKESG